MPPSLQTMLRIINFLNNRIGFSGQLCRFFFENCLLERESNLFFILKYILRRINDNINDIFTCSKNSVKSAVVAKLHPQVDSWKVLIIEELLCDRDDGTSFNNLKNTILKDILNFICINNNI